MSQRNAQNPSTKTTKRLKKKAGTPRNPKQKNKLKTPTQLKATCRLPNAVPVATINPSPGSHETIMDGQKLFDHIVAALEVLPPGWTERKREGGHRLPYVVLMIWLDNDDYATEVQLDRTEKSFFASVGCCRKDGRTPSHEELLKVLGSLFGREVVIDRSYEVPVFQRQNEPQIWQFDTEEVTPETKHVGRHLQLILATEPSDGRSPSRADALQQVS